MAERTYTYREEMYAPASTGVTFEEGAQQLLAEHISPSLREHILALSTVSRKDTLRLATDFMTADREGREILAEFRLVLEPQLITPVIDALEACLPPGTLNDNARRGIIAKIADDMAERVWYEALEGEPRAATLVNTQYEMFGRSWYNTIARSEAQDLIHGRISGPVLSQVYPSDAPPVGERAPAEHITITRERMQEALSAMAFGGDEVQPEDRPGASGAADTPASPAGPSQTAARPGPRPGGATPSGGH